MVLGFFTICLFTSGSPLFAAETSTNSNIATTNLSEEDRQLLEKYQQDSRQPMLSFEEYKEFNAAISNNTTVRTMTTQTTSVPYLTGERAKVVAQAKKYIGKPYTQQVPNRLGPNAFDCSGLVYRVFKEAVNKEVGNITTQQEKQGTTISVANARPGDLIFWGSKGNTHHVAIYIGNSQYIHAPTYGQNVNVSPIYWQAFEPSFAVRMNLNEQEKTINLNSYYTKKPKNISPLKKISYYKSAEFSSNTKVGTYVGGTKLVASKVVYAKDGTPVLKLNNGKYISAKKTDIRQYVYTKMNKQKYTISINNPKFSNEIIPLTKKYNATKGAVFSLSGKFTFDNGLTVYSMRNHTGKWVGYINSKDLTALKYVKWNKKVKITKANYVSYSNEFFKTKKITNTKSYLNKTFTAKGYYVLGNGRKYIAIYNSNNTFYGYVDARAIKTL